MASRAARLRDIYDSLQNADARAAVTSELIALLDKVPAGLADRVLSSALEVKTRHSSIPHLDLPSRKREIECILDHISRDSKYSLVNPERSRRNELFNEAAQTLLSWLQDIWRVVYEHSTQYETAHRCLIFAAESLVKLCESRGAGCKCPLNIPINVSIEKESGEVVKTFAFTGLSNIDHVILWVWRDLFVSMLVSSPSAAQAQIPQMLVDIEDVLTWQGLEWLLYGGQRYLSESSDDDLFGSIMGLSFASDTCLEDDDDELLDEVDTDGDRRCSCNLHASHWSDELDNERHTVREMVQDHLFKVFRTDPSVELYTSLKNINAERDSVTDEVYEILAEVQTYSSDNFVAALEIYSEECDADQIIELLEEYAHLLRPRDAQAHQRAVVMLLSQCDDEYEATAVRIIEQELSDTVRAVHASLRGCFSGIDEQANKDELDKIQKLRSASAQRQTRVLQWVEDVVTPSSSSPPNPIQFVAMMMGMPTPGGDNDGDADPFMYVDVDDDDMADLREAYRPGLKERFGGWVDAAGPLRTKVAQGLLMRVFKKVVGEMPFFRCADVVDEMMEHMADNPTTSHIVDALECLSSFCKLQRKTILMRNEKAKRAKAKMSNNKAAAQASTSTAGGSTGSTAATGSNGAGVARTSSQNDKDELDSPPPLIPIDLPASSSASAPPNATATTSSSTSATSPASAPASGSFPSLPIFMPTWLPGMTTINPFTPGGIEDVD
ncbi:hypothetical protein CCMSSC00406_0005984 [Pleurotus cornucopiae]|uniref:Uncharacterized protein n=1 Tax=Pleurotus cornucopiae TaxID=5321 RepID=A0ACB7IPK6_PLECO|nr:hypothetical protein CCMSSC00406_0005984 [Pleurotus cornucopiae]